MNTIKIENPKICEHVLMSVEVFMFPEMENEIRDSSVWIPINGVKFSGIESGRYGSAHIIGIQFSTFHNGKNVIRKVMIKDGTIDIDACRAKFEELKVLADQEAVDSRDRQEDQRALKTEVNEFFQSIPDFPPGFVIRNLGEGVWTVKFERTTDKDTVRRVVLAVKGALEEEAV